MSVAFAANTAHFEWNGAGEVGATVDADDDHTTSMYANGNGIQGNLDVIDHNNNPYGYGVDSVSSYLEHKGTSLGPMSYVSYQVDRKDSTSMYGDSGQQFYFDGYSFDGTIEVATGANSNFASLKSATYGKAKTTGGHNYEATGTYGMYQYIRDGAGDGAEFVVEGTGVAAVDSMSSEMHGSSFKFGKGAGSNTNADMDLDGVGHVRVSSWADNGINVDQGGLTVPGDGSDNSATYDLNVNYAGHFQYANYALDGK